MGVDGYLDGPALSAKFAFPFGIASSKDQSTLYVAEPTTHRVRAVGGFAAVPVAGNPPVADAGPDQDIECASAAGAAVTLDGSQSTDPDSTAGTNDDIVSIEWFEGATLIATVVVSATSNEPDNSLGDGDTEGDIQITGSQLFLRAERSGTGTGRIYTITLRATDASGNFATSTATVTVPHDQGQGAPQGQGNPPSSQGNSQGEGKN